MIMTTPKSIIESLELKAILELTKEGKVQQQEAAYNLFTLSSYNNQLENFHSDVLASLLDPNALHNEGARFLTLFIDYLNKVHNCDIEKASYINVSTTRELGRIDIWVRDEEKKHCIIIENKINNAPDTEDQLSVYYDYSVSRGYKVDTIIYLSLDGSKKAPYTNRPEIEKLVKNVDAYKPDTQNKDIVSGWLHNCFHKCNGDDGKTLIYQYLKLIKHLNSTAMLNDAKDKFYDLISSKDSYEAAKQIAEWTRDIGIYRRDRFFDKWDKGAAPFHKVFKNYHYGNCGVLFEYFEYNKFSFKIDVYFIGANTEKLEQCSSMVRVWTPFPHQDNYLGRVECMGLLSEMGLDSEFKREKEDIDNSMVAKRFYLEEEGSMKNVDEATFQLVDRLITGFKEVANR